MEVSASRVERLSSLREPYLVYMFAVQPCYAFSLLAAVWSGWASNTVANNKWSYSSPSPLPADLNRPQFLSSTCARRPVAELSVSNELCAFSP